MMNFTLIRSNGGLHAFKSYLGHVHGLTRAHVKDLTCIDTLKTRDSLIIVWSTETQEC